MHLKDILDDTLILQSCILSNRKYNRHWAEAEGTKAISDVMKNIDIGSYYRYWL